MEIGQTYLVHVPLKRGRTYANREAPWHIRMHWSAGSRYPVSVTAVDTQAGTVDGLREVARPAGAMVELTPEQTREEALLPPRDEPYFLSGTVVDEDGQPVWVPTAMEEFAIPVRWLEPFPTDWTPAPISPELAQLLPSMLDGERKIRAAKLRLQALEAQQVESVSPTGE